MYLLLPRFSVSDVPVPVCCAATRKPFLPVCGALSRCSSGETLPVTPCMGRGSLSPTLPCGVVCGSTPPAVTASHHQSHQRPVILISSFQRTSFWLSRPSLTCFFPSSSIYLFISIIDFFILLLYTGFILLFSPWLLKMDAQVINLQLFFYPPEDCFSCIAQVFPHNIFIFIKF